MAEKSTKTKKLTKNDVDFIAFSLDEHNTLLKRHYGISWERNTALEIKRSEEIKKAMELMVKTGTTKISEDDFYFIEFGMKERADFAAEGVGRLWTTSPTSDVTKTVKTIKKLAAICGFKPAIGEGCECDLPF